MILRPELPVMDWRRLRVKRRLVNKLVVWALVGVGGVLISIAPANGMHCSLGNSPVDIAEIETRKFAFEAYPQWERVHPHACPSIADLLDYMDRPRVNDPWGSGNQLSCDAKGVRVWSLGEDRKPNTGDDIRSWE